MRYFDEDEVAQLNAEAWQIDLLKLNPEYLCWGPHEDYMWNEKGGWDGRKIFPTWSDFGPWDLDDLNECVNFYFSVNRDSKDCETCKGNGYHKEAQGIVNTFYSHMNTNGEHWNDKITEDEVAALLEAGRLMDWTRQGKIPSAEEVNEAERKVGMGHDAINRGILTRARLKRLGVPETCDECEGHGYIYTAPTANVSLTLWWLHPRKGCSRGIKVEQIERSELAEVMSFLRAAAKRNAGRFAKIFESSENFKDSDRLEWLLSNLSLYWEDDNCNEWMCGSREGIDAAMDSQKRKGEDAR